MGVVKQIVKIELIIFATTLSISKTLVQLWLLQIDKKPCKNIDIYYIGYITIKKMHDYKNIYSVNPLYLKKYIEEKMEINT